MTTHANPIFEIIRMLPRLAVIAMLVGATAFAVSKVNAAPGSAIVQTTLDGLSVGKRNGVGFVLAVTLQRT